MVINVIMFLESVSQEEATTQKDPMQRNHLHRYLPSQISILEKRLIL